MRLYSFTITPNNRKVEAFVRHFDLPVEVHQVSFKDQETRRPGYLAINPMGKVPALTDGDFCLWESNAILTYLAARFPETHTLTADIQGRADIDRWLHWQSCHLAPAIAGFKTSDGREVSAVGPLLTILDDRLGEQPHLLGGLTVVDFAIAPYLLTKAGRQLDYSAVPRLAAWLERIMDLKGFRDTQVKPQPTR